MLRFLSILSCLAACTVQTAPVPAPTGGDVEASVKADASIDPASVHELLPAQDGKPQVGEIELGECSSKVVIREADGWKELNPIGGNATVIRKHDTLAGYSTCSEHLSEVFIGEQLFKTGLPEFPGAIRFLDGNRISFTGHALIDPTLTEVVFVRSGDRWSKAETNTCEPFDAKEVGTPLLAADLNSDGATDHVIELADSCGTGSCTTQVFLACAEEGTARMVADIDQWTGVELGPETHGGHRDLISTIKDGDKPKDVVLQWTDEGYRRR